MIVFGFFAVFAEKGFKFGRSCGIIPPVPVSVWSLRQNTGLSILLWPAKGAENAKYSK
jgi:hypothetical protein